MKYIFQSNAKINLALDVIRKRDDGYHDLKMIMQTISLSDTLSFEILEEDEIIITSNKSIPLNKYNIVYKTVELLKENYKFSHGFRINIEKNIPVSAGLAGGSTNCATTIKALNKILNLNIPNDDMFKIGKTLGADVPFCLMGGTALVEGIGDILTPLHPLPEKFVLLVKPNVDVSTKNIFQALDLSKIDTHPEFDTILNNINSNIVDPSTFFNVLEKVTIPMFPIINTVKDELIKIGGKNPLMSGSGSTVFCFYEDENEAVYAKNYISEKFPNFKDIIITKTVS